jgi:serine-type D-Ala-D-Ala carboxypeptidase/endopeptidase
LKTQNKVNQMKKAFLLIVIVLLISSIALGQLPVQSPIPPDDQIRKILQDRLDKYQDRIGIVVGVIEPSGRRIIAVGSLGKDDKRPLNGDTVFEIGSITKVFTSLLLADMVQQGKVALTDPVAKFLPAEVKMPERGGRAITLENLARHRSGLPRMPTNMTPVNLKDPYADYSVKQLYDFISGYTLPRDIDSQFEYSNLGGGLLGHVLGLAAGQSYEPLIRTRIAQPLGMNNTAITLSPDLQSRLAIGHDAAFEAASNWSLPTLAGAGALRSTANDMLSFLAAQLGYKKSSLDPAIALTRSKWVSAGTGMEIGLGWFKRPRKDGETIWHNGGTGGYRSFAGFDLKTKTGVVVLTNVFTQAGVDDLGFHLLDPESPILPAGSPALQPPKERKEITLEPNILDVYVGKYQFAPTISMTITRKDNQLFAQLAGQQPIEIFPETQTDFFSRVVDAQIVFKTDGQGKAIALVLLQAGSRQLAKRIEGEPGQEWFGHTEKSVDPAIYKNYVGQYQLAPGVIITMSLKDNHLYTQLTGQQPIEVFPESERDFFLKVVDAQFIFESDGKGPATAVTLRQNGRETRSPRIAE